jgi:hypothetical protein
LPLRRGELSRRLDVPELLALAKGKLLFSAKANFVFFIFHDLKVVAI